MPFFLFYLLPIIFLIQSEIHWEVQESITKANLRGLSVVNDHIVWASGSGATVIRTTDGGLNWMDVSLREVTDLDFRDIQAFDANTAIIISAGKPARIYKTTDGGKTWLLNFEDNSASIFYDGMDFWNDTHGIAYGDPIDQYWELAITLNAGNNWVNITPAMHPLMQEGEAGFAASGTGIEVFGSNLVWIASGGAETARIFKSKDAGMNWLVYNTPLRSSKAAGIFSIVFMNELEGIIVGGDYVDSTNRIANCALTKDGGESWDLVEENNPNGYRSCVCWLEKKELLITVGRTGSEYSTDNGKSWQFIGKYGYYSCAAGETIVWAAGRAGRVAKLKFK